MALLLSPRLVARVVIGHCAEDTAACSMLAEKEGAMRLLPSPPELEELRCGTYGRIPPDGAGPADALLKGEADESLTPL